MIKYLGSKRTLLPTIGQAVQGLAGAKSVIDLFSGTSRVGHHLKGLGYQVFSNDLNSYAYNLATCYVVANKEDYTNKVPKILKEMAALPPIEGYFTHNFCQEAQFFQPHNGRRIDAMREWIEEQEFDAELKAVVLVSLMEAADRVDSTCGIQMAFLKNWASRSFNDLELRLPNLHSQPAPGKCGATLMDAQVAVKHLSADVGYLDPPYNQHKYLGNYHIWESLVLWDKPEVYGKARKRVDVKEKSSDFNSKKRIMDSMTQVVHDLDVKHILVSFNNEGYISKDEMVEILSSRGDVFVIEKDYKRYVGAQIGIYNPSGDKVGDVSHVENKEFIFLVSENADLVQAIYKKHS